MPYFTYTRLNQDLDLLPVIGFQHFIALWKAFNKSKQIAKFLQRKGGGGGTIRHFVTSKFVQAAFGPKN